MPLKNFRPAVAPGKKFALTIGEDWDPEEIYSIAKETFASDCRFALDYAQADTKLKNELLYGFIRELKRKEFTATLIYNDKNIEGFNLWNIHEGKGRIFLGAISEKYRNSGIALSLYSHTAEAMRERDAGALRNIVSCTNTASLNLHALLARCAGGVFRFGNCRDNYILNRIDADR